MDWKLKETGTTTVDKIIGKKAKMGLVCKSWEIQDVFQILFFIEMIFAFRVTDKLLWK